MYRVALGDAQEFRWDKGEILRVDVYNLFSVEKKMKDVEIKCQLDATEVFIADLIACSTCFGHHYVHS